MNVLRKFTARVLLVTQSERSTPLDFKKNKQDQELLEMIKYIHQDPFLKAQVAQIDVLKNQEMVLYLQLGRQVVDFGNLTQWKSKLDRFKVL